MTSDEFVQFMKGIAIGIKGTPDESQWAIIIKKLMATKRASNIEDGKQILVELKKEVDKGYQEFRKAFPGAPPNIFM